MVYVIGTQEVAPGRMQEAQEWNRKFYAYLKKTYGIEGQVLAPLTAGPGQAHTLAVITPYDSLTAWAAHMERVAKDPQRNAFMKEAFEEKQYFVAEKGTRTVYTPI